MKNQMPNLLPNGRGSFSKAGAAPEPGGTRYCNMATGRQTTVYESLATNTGGRFIQVAVRNNQVLNKVRVPNKVIFGGERIAVGDSLLVGGIKITGDAPEATMAWPFRAPNTGNGHHTGNSQPLRSPSSRPARRVGSVSRIHPGGKFGEILEDRTGHRYFAHHSQFENGARLMAGFRVSFTAAKTERGSAALDIKPN